MALNSSYYILVGSEPVRRRHLLNKLRDQAGEWESYSASEVSPEEVLSASLLLDPEAPLVRVINDYSKWSTAQRKKFAQIVSEEDIPSGLCLVFCIDRLGAKDPLRIAAAKESILELEQPTRGKYPAWAVRQAKLSGVDLNTSASEILVRMVGENTEALANEIDKLALVSESPNISVAQIKEIVVSSPQTRIWQWVDSLIAAEPKKSMEYLLQCEEAEESPLALTGALQSRILQLAWASQMTQQESEIKEYPWKLAQSAIKTGWTQTRIRQALLALSELDFNLKGGSELDGYLQLARFCRQGI